MVLSNVNLSCDRDKNSHNHKQIKQIVILGGGTAGWMTAAALSKLLPANRFSITLVESNQIGTVGVGEATLPHLRFFNQRLGIDEAEFMRATQATFKVGIEFSNWGNVGDAYIHPFGDYGQKINNIPFYHFWLQQNQQANKHKKTSLDQYSLPVMACLANKFSFPDGNPSKLQSTYSYAYHIDAGLYAKYLRHFSEKLGTKRIEGKVIDVITRCGDGHIEALLLENGERVTGEFFVDCSGFRGQLIEQVMNAGYEDWSHWLPCNKAIAIATEQPSEPLTYTKAIAREAGWQWRIPLQHRLGNGYVYSDQFINKEQALSTLENNLVGKPQTDANFLSFTTGRRKQAWIKNCMAIGLSSGFLEPLESTSIYLIQSAIMKLVELVPDYENLACKAQEYNRSLDMEMEKIRDFLILHYHATSRDDTAFWQYCKDMAIPDSLSEKMKMFNETGHIQTYQYGLFLEPSWLAVYIGQGIMPSAYDTRVDALMKKDAIFSEFAQLPQQIDEWVKKMPDHSAFIQSFCYQQGAANPVAAQMNLYGRKN